MICVMYLVGDSESVGLSVCLSVCLSVRLSVCLSIASHISETSEVIAITFDTVTASAQS